MGRPKRLYPLGRYRLRVPKDAEVDKAYPVVLEYTWNRQIIRKTTNVFAKIADWNQNGNQGRGELRVSYGSEYKRLNQLLLSRVERIDSLLAEYNELNPNQITEEVVAGFLADKPLARRDQGKDFVEFALERLSSDYSRNRIGRSRYENGKSCMNIFQTFLRATKQGSYRPDAIYVGDMTPELLDSYITWRREVKLNSDATINHALTPILKACAYASEMGMMEPAVNARIQDMRIVSKVSLSEEEAEFDGKSLSKEQMFSLLEYYKTTPKPRRKEFLEMFFFAFHACGLRVVDVMTLQWKHIDFARKELRKIMIKTNKRHVIPLTEPALKYSAPLARETDRMSICLQSGKGGSGSRRCGGAVQGPQQCDQVYQPVVGGCRRTDRASVYPLNACGPAFVCGLCPEQGPFYVGCQPSARPWEYGCHRKGLCQIPARNAVGRGGKTKRRINQLDYIITVKR